MSVTVLLMALVLGVLVAPLAAAAQPPAHRPTVGWLEWGGRADKAHLYAEFLQGLRELGYVEGHNLGFFAQPPKYGCSPVSTLKIAKGQSTG